MKPAKPRSLLSALLTLGTLALASCGGGQEPAPPQQAQACPACPVCDATPTPSAEDIRQLLEKLEKEAVKKFRTNPESFKAAAAQFGIADKIGKKEISAEDFPRFVSFFWQVDPEFRIQQLRAMMTTNRLMDMLKPAVGKFDINVSPKDPEAEDASLLVSQAIVDWAQVQRILEDNFMSLGVENVMGVKPSDEMPHAETMMVELRELLTPATPPSATPGPQATSASLLSLLVSEAQAQAQPLPKGKTGAATAKISKAVPRVKVKEAPLLLARVISFNVGGTNFVLRSPLMAAIPEFQAIPVDQFQFKLEKLSVGPAYRDKVDAMVQELAAKPKRDMVDWWNLSHGLIELRLLNQLVDPSKVDAAVPAPNLSPLGTGTTTQAGGTEAAPSDSTQRPTLPTPERQNPDTAQPRPSTSQGAAPQAAPEARPSPATPDQAVPAPTRPEAAPRPAQTPAGAERPSSQAPATAP